MRRVIFNQKGGVGKSSITVNLAAVSASQGLKTLVLDLDPQCNATQYLLGEVAEYAPDKPELQPNIGQFFAQTLSLKGREKPLLEYVHPTPFENLHVIPSNPELGEIEHLLQSAIKFINWQQLLKL
ncbi:MAG: AAA family ATPase [Moraxellaceae bacterium]|nr:AAA family ATPase [Moraxellaceae bacterium]